MNGSASKTPGTGDRTHVIKVLHLVLLHDMVLSTLCICIGSTSEEERNAGRPSFNCDIGSEAHHNYSPPMRKILAQMRLHMVSTVRYSRYVHLAGAIGDVEAFQNATSVVSLRSRVNMH